MKFLAKAGFLTSLLLASLAHANENKLNDVHVEVTLLCPMSQELQNLTNIIPPVGSTVKSYEEWSNNCVATLQKLIELIQSGKVGNCEFKAYAKPQEN